MNTYTQSLYLHAGHKLKPSQGWGDRFVWHCETCNMDFNLHPTDNARAITEYKEKFPSSKPTAQDFKRWAIFLEDVLEWVSCIDCEQPAGMHCSRIDTDGGEEACMPCRCKEAYQNISLPHGGEKPV